MGPNPVPAAPSTSARVSHLSPGSAQLRTDEAIPHRITYIAIFVFTFVLYFRPYELFPSLAGLDSLAYWCALFAIASYLVTQLACSKGLTILTTETKCVLVMIASALLLMPFSRDVARSWEVFLDPFIRVMIIFLILANILVTETRIKGLMWLGVAIGVYLSYQAYDLFQKGVFNTEETRVSVNFGGMFGNPNDLCIHLLIFIPISLALAKTSRSSLTKVIGCLAALLMMFAVLLTQSRGGFIGLVVVVTLLVWKVGQGKRLRALMLALALLGSTIAIAPSSFGTRMMTLLNLSSDFGSSSGQRRENLERSILVSLRNPQGVGLGNSRTFGVRNLETHNAYTQVSTELGLIAFFAYLVLLIVPFRDLWRMEGETDKQMSMSTVSSLMIGTQIAIAGYMVSSFFASVAYGWYVYFPIAYAVGFRVLYQNEKRAQADRSTHNGLEASLPIFVAPNQPILHEPRAES